MLQLQCDIGTYVLVELAIPVVLAQGIYSALLLNYLVG